MERCPVCRARLGGLAVCRRCGCDLGWAQEAAREGGQALARALRALVQDLPEQALVEAERAARLDPSPLALRIAAFVRCYRDHLPPPAEGWVCRYEGWW